jgi:hypothetical protein
MLSKQAKKKTQNTEISFLSFASTQALFYLRIFAQLLPLLECFFRERESFLKNVLYPAWRYTSIILALGGLRWELKSSMGHIVRTCLKKSRTGGV